ncbi:MAG: GspH/FimT family pseudopilin [Pseudomonadota bacterium]
MNQRGLTLPELAITLAIGSILLGMAIPGYAYLVRSVRFSGLSGELVGALAYARSEAIKRGVRVTVCKTGNAASCQSAAGWHEGWLVFVDEGVRGVVDGTDTVLRARADAVDDVTVTVSNFTTHVSYLPSGISRAPNNLSNGSIHFCLDGVKRSVILNTTGRVRTSTGSC